MAALDGTDLQRIAQERYGVSGTVWHVAASGGSDGGAGTSWLAPFATVEHAIGVAAARDMILCGPGVHTFTIGTGIALPASVCLKGAGRGLTELQYGNPDNFFGITPGSHSVIEDMTLNVVFDGYAISTQLTTQVVRATVRRCDIITSNLECVVINSTAACDIAFEDCYIASHTEWPLTADLAAHQIRWNRVTTYTIEPGADDSKAFVLNAGSVMVANDCSFLASENGSNGKVFEVLGASAAILSNCHCFAGEINIGSLLGYVLMTNCHFDRSKVTGTGLSRLVDIMGLPAGTITAASIANDAITAAKVATGAIDADAVAADAVTEIVAGVFAFVTETGLTFQHYCQGTWAVLGGKRDGASSTTQHFRNYGDSKNRLTTVVDWAGNRSTLTWSFD